MIKIIILAGGWGTRLGRQSELIPKPMVSIGKRPMLWHIMKIYSSYGFNDFVLSLGVKAEIIRNFFIDYNINSQDISINLATGQVKESGTNMQENWNIDLIDTGLNTLKGARIKRVEKYLNSDINMLTYGDGVANIEIDKLLSFHKSHGKTLTITGVHPPARFGEIIEEDGLVKSFEEKPQTSSGLINGGFMVFNRNLLDNLSNDENCDFEFGTLDKLVDREEVMVYKHLGNWECMDNERDVEHLNKLWNSGNAFWKNW